MILMFPCLHEHIAECISTHMHAWRHYCNIGPSTVYQLSVKHLSSLEGVYSLIY